MEIMCREAMVKYSMNMDPSQRRTDWSDQKENEDGRMEARAASFTSHTNMIFSEGVPENLSDDLSDHRLLGSAV